MKSGRHNVGVRTPGFSSTQRRHEKYRTSNSYSAIRRTSHMAPGPDGVKCIDWDTQAVRGRNVVGGPVVTRSLSAHWSDIKRNGYTHKLVGKHLVRLTARELKMTLQQWLDAHGGVFASLRLLRRVTKACAGDHPLFLEEAVRYAKRYGVVLCRELKSNLFALDLSLATWEAAVCRKYDYPNWSMALPTLAGLQWKCRNQRANGGSFFVIYGKSLRGHTARARRTQQLSKHWDMKPTGTW